MIIFCSAFMHGALSLRVANGEVDVYLGEDMSISKDVSLVLFDVFHTSIAHC